MLALRNDDIYSTKRVELPTPVYIVFYNGGGMQTDILIKQKAEVLHMILTEYDEKKHFRTLFQEGKEEGIKEGWKKGREEHLRELIKKKLAKGKTVAEIAEDLEEEISVIEQIIETPRSDLWW